MKALVLAYENDNENAIKMAVYTGVTSIMELELNQTVISHSEGQTTVDLDKYQVRVIA